MHDTLRQLMIILPMVFLAGFVDAIAGGGGLISLPAYLIAGVPVHMALGTNKFAMALGTALSTGRFLKEGLIRLRVAAIAVPAALLGSWGGARLALMLDGRVMKMLMMAVLPVVMLWIWFRRGQPEGNGILPEKALLKAGLAGLLIGAYDGLIGPGTGTFLILIFTAWLNLSVLEASGTAKSVNLASNIAAFVTFLAKGQLIFLIGMPAAACAIAGNWLGSHLAIRNGQKLVRPVMGLVMVLLLVRLGYDVLAG